MRVLPSTADGYERDWLRSWVPFVDSPMSQGDYYLQSQELEIVVLFLAGRYDKGMRAKQATVPLGAVRHMFLKEGLSTDFLESRIVVAAREGCKRRHFADELLVDGVFNPKMSPRLKPKWYLA